MLLIAATRYDAVTARTLTVAESLLHQTADNKLPATALFVDDARGEHLRRRLDDCAWPVVAFYCHGDDRGQLLAQDQKPFGSEEDVPDFRRSTIVAHACRAMVCLERQFPRLNACAVVGYRIDVKLPPNGSEMFWNLYRQLHAVIPLRLAQATDVAKLRIEFYQAASEAVARVYQTGGSLIELIALQQSRDELVILTGRGGNHDREAPFR